MFKVRASYGELGNENIGEFAYQATMNRNNMTYSFGNQAVTGSAISTFVNENIAWEKKKTMNVGLDLAMFNNRLEFTAEWYKNISTDLLYNVPVPANAGVANTSVTMNAAEMENSGLEFSATYRNHDHPLKYDISANLSTLKNKVTSLGFGALPAHRPTLTTMPPRVVPTWVTASIRISVVLTASPTVWLTPTTRPCLAVVCPRSASV